MFTKVTNLIIIWKKPLPFQLVRVVLLLISVQKITKRVTCVTLLVYDILFPFRRFKDLDRMFDKTVHHLAEQQVILSYAEL